ncbi:MAG: helix-turn-helix domain-containing protein [Flavobacteriaceae bacterium]|jgi:HTH-type transcriptional regulator/antitoxin HigA|nr:helix-turn-helix domain-containing protein [Flavobacteriaceae bacterium]
MRTIQSKEEYNALCARIEELLTIVGNDTPVNSQEFIELDFLSDLVATYEETIAPIEVPTLIEIIKLRMYERNLNQKNLAVLLGISTSRVSEYLTGKGEPPLKVARDISKKLDIDPSIVLGV